MAPKMKYVVLLAVAAGALFGLWYFWGMSRTPPGQPPLVSLSEKNFIQFTDEFNKAGDRPRLVLLLSPT
jgi:hypothetical protein